MKKRHMYLIGAAVTVCGMVLAIGYASLLSYFEFQNLPPEMKPIVYKADDGDVASQSDLAFRYFQGIGVKPDIDNFLKWATRAAEQKDNQALHLLGLYYINNLNDFPTGLRFLRQADRQGYPLSAEYIGVMYVEGKGVAKSPEKAVEWWRRAYELGGYGDNLGFAYETGSGVSVDKKEAAIWWRRAAERGNLKGAFATGMNYLYGNGVEKSYEAAARWFRVAAEQSIPDKVKGYNDPLFSVEACTVLGVLYASGRGVQQSDAMAYFWWRKAVERGSKKAQDYITEFALRSKP